MERKILLALLFWFFYALINIAIRVHHDGANTKVFMLINLYAINGIFVYAISIFVFPLISRAIRTTLAISLILLLLFVYAYLVYLNEMVFVPWYYDLPKPGQIKTSDLIVAVTPYYLNILLFATGLFVYKSLIRKSEKLAKAEAQVLAAENSRLNTEAKALALEAENNQLTVEYLRAQINPHFLNNTLTAIQDEIFDVSPTGTDQIATLGELMDYSLQEAGPDGKVLLRDEIEAIENLLSLVKIRIKKRYAVVFTVKGEVTGQQIGIHLLLTLAENLVKYGFVDAKEHPATIELNINENLLKMKLHNWNRNDKQVPSTGIGLKNIRRRLELLYPGRHNLEVISTAETYQTTLTLTL